MIFQPSSVKMDDKSKNFFVFVIALILLFYGVSVGVNITSFSLFLHKMGIPQSQISNILSMELTGILIAAPIFPKLCERFGITYVLIGSLILRCLAIIAFPMSENLKLNMLFLLISGLGSFCTLTTIWFWGASLLKDGTRSTMIAIMNVAFASGIAIGIGALFLKANKMPVDLFKTSALFSVFIVPAIYFVKDSAPILPRNTSYTPPSTLIKYIMLPVISMLAANYLLLSLNNFAVVYAIKSNVPYHEAVVLNLYMLAGNLILTIPAAFILDKMKSKHVFLSIILTLICLASVGMPFVIGIPKAPMILFGLLSSLIWLVLVYAISIVSAKFKNHNLLAATTILSIMHSMGGYAGVSATKAAVEYWGNQGLVISMAIVSLFVLLYVINTSSEE